MTHNLGTMADLPPDYRQAMSAQCVTPLWPSLRNLLPLGQPVPVTQPTHWSFAAIRPLLLRAGHLTPVEKAERRVLVLSDGGRGDGAMQATSTIYVGMQLLLPGEVAPAHRHTPSAARIVVEGEGAFTVVDGEKCLMHPGDLILTPAGAWHDHGHGGAVPVIWLDALDLPLFVYLEGSYAEEGPVQSPSNRPDASQVEYLASGLSPVRRRGSGPTPRFPLNRYPWTRTRLALDSLSNHSGPGEPVELDYVNPESGDSCLPTLGFTAMLLRDGEPMAPTRRSSSAVFHVVEGQGVSTVDGSDIGWSRGDSFSAPAFARIRHQAIDGPACLIRIHDQPLQEKLGLYEERPH